MDDYASTDEEYRYSDQDDSLDDDDDAFENDGQDYGLLSSKAPTSQVAFDSNFPFFIHLGFLFHPFFFVSDSYFYRCVLIIDWYRGVCKGVLNIKNC